MELPNGSGKQAASAFLDAFAANLGSAAIATTGADNVSAVNDGGGPGRDKGKDTGKLHFEGKVDCLRLEMWLFYLLIDCIKGR